MDKNRKTAYYALSSVELKKAYSNIALHHHIIRGKPDSPAFVRQLVYGVLESKMTLDYILDQLVPSGVEKLRKSDRIVLRMGLYQLAYMNVPIYAAVDESVRLAKRFCKGHEGFINATLRTYVRNKEKINLPERGADEVRYLSIRYSYEPWIVELWREQYTAEFVEKMLGAGNVTPGVDIRANGLRITRDDLEGRLVAQGYTVKPGALSESALRITGGTKMLTETGLYKQGKFSIQDEGSMLVTAMLDPKPGDVVVDVCAAPGGKTLAIAERMHNNGQIVASDIYVRKLEIINKEAKRLGVSIIETKTWDAAKVNSAMIGKADRVLADVPCSGLGVVRRKPEIKYKKRTADMELLPKKQLEILTASSQYVKVGGVLVYSTCTINADENQKVVSEFLKKNPAFKKAEKIQLMPNVNGTDGIFICKMVNQQG